MSTARVLLIVLGAMTAVAVIAGVTLLGGGTARPQLGAVIDLNNINSARTRAPSAPTTGAATQTSAPTTSPVSPAAGAGRTPGVTSTTAPGTRAPQLPRATPRQTQRERPAAIRSTTVVRPESRPLTRVPADDDDDDDDDNDDDDDD